MWTSTSCVSTQTEIASKRPHSHPLCCATIRTRPFHITSQNTAPRVLNTRLRHIGTLGKASVLTVHAYLSISTYLVTRSGRTHTYSSEPMMFVTVFSIVALQILSPFCGPARGASSTYSQSQEVEAELQQLIQSRLKTGQAPLPELAQKSPVSPWAALIDLVSQVYTHKLQAVSRCYHAWVNVEAHCAFMGTTGITRHLMSVTNM